MGYRSFLKGIFKRLFAAFAGTAAIAAASAHAGDRRVGVWVQTQDPAMKAWTAEQFVEQAFYNKPFYSHASFHIGGPEFAKGDPQIRRPVEVAQILRKRGLAQDDVELEAFLSFDICSEGPITASWGGKTSGWKQFEDFTAAMAAGKPFVRSVGIWGEWFTCQGQRKATAEEKRQAMRRARGIVEAQGFVFASEGTRGWDPEAQYRNEYFNPDPVWCGTPVPEDLRVERTPALYPYKASIGMISGAVRDSACDKGRVMGHAWTHADVTRIFDWLSAQPDSLAALELMGTTRPQGAQPCARKDYLTCAVEWSPEGREWIWNELRRRPQFKRHSTARHATSTP